ncbi:MAG: transglutaminase family protein [Terracidiphilus sp.]
MGIQVALHHRTVYRYDKAITLGPQVIQLRPAFHSRTPILDYSLNITPQQHLINWQLDPHANRLARVLFSGKTSEFVVEVDLVADLFPINPFDFFLEPGVENFPFAYEPALARDLEPYRQLEAPGPLLQAFLADFVGRTSGTIALLIDLNRKVRGEIAYGTRLEPGVQTCAETLEKRSGSCRDSAWLLVQCLRNLGIAARFVSGYLIQLAAEEGAPDGPKTDSADLHAWAEAFLPGAGWIGLDPTSGLLAGEGHIPLVCTPNAAQAAPISGTAEPAKVDFSHFISVRRLNETPRTSKPFTDADWLRVRQLAHGVDAELKAQDVRLTMGGEPTYVGIDDPESPQWNIDALGSIKRTRGIALIQALRARMAPGALLHYGQGKWYPGEPLPRWALSCYWRANGVPVWEAKDLIAKEDGDYGYGAADAFRFMQALTRRLQVTSENALPAYDAEAMTEPVGYVLPIRRRQPDGHLRWSSQLWFPRPQRLTLSAGDSPIGFRIPTDAVPWVAPDELAYEFDDAPFADRAKLPARCSRRMDLFQADPAPDPLPAVSRAPETAPELIRPSLCVQAREGRLHVFLPYAPQLADYLDLVSAVEDTCSYLNIPVWVEGYAPSADPRLRSFSVTPDPGVLEINLPPTSNWDELEHVNTLLDEEARRNRLTAEKFAYDGRHQATGGGSHIVVGGVTVLDSPFLRRPDLLRSMVAFWQNHPSLSYLFSGMYVGPTSQYPRVDEARMDALYELEVAFSNLPADNCPAYIVDGLFRNLLVDVTGNSHRAEFCVDKLFPPPGHGLQLGLLELRAFEMAPHVRMNLLQMLLIRALVCMLWKTPFNGGLTRWGTALHDRFMLPHFVNHDLYEVLAQLRKPGFNFDEAWFAAHLEFRFPKLGSVAAEGMELELRQALEPWNVLAEETVSGGTVRSVDSSLERLQVKLSGVTGLSRYVVTCNGRKVPLQLTSEPGVAVAGVRYRARRLSATLHPTIPVHGPLVFNLIDRLTGRSIAQCTYHVGPPDGRLYSARPANAAEAEQRRMERFQAANTAVPMAPPMDESNPLFPMTLDLRLPPPSAQSQGEIAGIDL